MAVLEIRQHQYFLPAWRFAFGAKDFQFNDLMLRGKLDEIKRIDLPKKRAQVLLSELGKHHLVTLYHSFEVGIITYRLAEIYYKEGGYDLPESIRRKIFVGGLLHDIGKLGVAKEILNREGPLDKDQKAELVKHGKIGQIILEETDLKEFVPFATEHHIGNSGLNNWTKDQLASRHPFVEFLSMGDLFSALLDSRRKYNKIKTIDQVKNMIRKKTKNGVFSPALEQSFFEYLRENNSLPPFNDQHFRNDKMMKWFFDVK